MTEVEFPTRVSARAIIAGVLVALAFDVMLMVLGAAIGLTAFAPRAGAANKGLSIGFAAWLLLTLVVGAFVGGWVATGAARAVRRRDGVLHGLVTWAAVTLVGISLAGGALQQMAATADQAGGKAMGTWGMFAGLLFPLLAAIGGGVIAAARERRIVGLPSERELRHREPKVVSPSRAADVPTRPLPTT